MPPVRPAPTLARVRSSACTLSLQVFVALVFTLCGLTCPPLAKTATGAPAPAPATGENAAKEAAPRMPEQPAGVPYWDNWTDGQGVSHLTKCKLRNFTLMHMAAHADPQWVNHAQQGQARMVTSVQPAAWKGGWHAPESVQWIIPIQGVWFVQSMDGTRVELNPGDALLSEDVGGKPDPEGHVGHLSGNVGDAPVALMITQFAAAQPSHAPCQTR